MDLSFSNNSSTATNTCYERHILQLIPLATFDDLIEAMSLIEHNNGVRPYILRWFNDVFIPAYESKNEPDIKDKGGITLSENRCAVTTRELIEKTAEIQNKRLSPKQILETYLNPLINLNVISSEPSIIDRRFNIYYPVKQRSENKNLFDYNNQYNISQLFQIRIEDSTLFPDQTYKTHEIERVLNCSSDSRDKLVNHDGMERPVQEIARSYYSNFDDCFKSGNIRATLSYNSIRYDYLVSNHISKEYHSTHQNDIKIQINCSIHEKTLPVKAEHSIKLYGSCESNNFLYPNDENRGRTGSIDSSTSMDAHGTTSQMPEINSNIQLRKAVSTTHSPITNPSCASHPNIESINQFFYDEPYMPYQPPPPHELEDSPCKSIIRFDKHSLLYNCILHPDFQSYHLESIEHHIKFKNPEMHKSEILKLLNMYQPSTSDFFT